MSMDALLPGDRARRLRVVVLIVLSLALLTYTVLRAITVSFSWDESWTFAHHVRPGVLWPRAFDNMGANHHLLNVWAMWGCWKLFGGSELALRLPNLFAHACYLYATARLVLHARSTLLMVLCFLLLNVHPYLLDFFSLARGYGLASGWIMLALWQAYRYVQEGERIRHLAWGLVFAALSALSLLALLNFLLAYAGTFLAYWCLRDRSTVFRTRRIELVVIAVITVAALGVLLPIAFALKHGGSLYYGCDTFYTGTLRTLGEKWLYHYDYHMPPLTIVTWVIGAVAVWLLVVVLVAWRLRAWKQLRIIGFAVALLGLLVVVLGAQHLLMHVLWPRSRTALFLVPLAAFVLVVAMLQWSGRAWVPTLVAACFCTPLLLHASHCANTTFAIEWRPSGEVRRMLELIAQDHVPLTEQRPIVTLSCSAESMGSLCYYRPLMPWLAPKQRNVGEPFAPSDHYIVEFDGYDRVDTVNWTLLYRSTSTNTALYRDDRLRSPSVVAHLSWDLEDTDLPGRYTMDHVSGHQCVRFDTLTRAVRELVWTVPDGFGPAPLLVCGTAHVKQHDDTNWLGLLITVRRKGTDLLQRDEGSNPQVRAYDAWGPMAVMMRINEPLLPGDEVHFSLAPLASYPPLYADDLALWVMQ